MKKKNAFLQFLKDWTLPVAIAVGSVFYLVFLWVPALDELGNQLGPIIDFIFPLSVFGTLFVTFCKVDFHQMRPHRWHIGVLMAQLLLVAVVVAVIFGVQRDANEKILWEAVLTCIIAPSASAAPVVTGKLGGNISTMSAFTVISSFASALMIPFVFPLLEQTVHVSFWSAFLIILQKVATVLVLPLVLGWLVQHTLPRLHDRIVGMPNLSFYCWAFSLSITSGITVKNIVHSCSRRTRPLPSGWPTCTCIPLPRWALAAMCFGRTSSTVWNFGPSERKTVRRRGRSLSCRLCFAFPLCLRGLCIAWRSGGAKACVWMRHCRIILNEWRSEE